MLKGPLYKKSEIMDGFWSSRCLNDCIDVPDKIGSLSSGTTTSMVVKMELNNF